MKDTTYKIFTISLSNLNTCTCPSYYTNPTRGSKVYMLLSMQTSIYNTTNYEKNFQMWEWQEGLVKCNHS